MTDVRTRHYKDDSGAQHTERVVTVEDATGQEYEHVFELTDDGHEYQGDGEPPNSAIGALEGFENGGED